MVTSFQIVTTTMEKQGEVMYSPQVQGSTQAVGYSTPRLVSLGSIQAFILGVGQTGVDAVADLDLPGSNV